MEKSFIKIETISKVLLMSVFAFVITSCQKTNLSPDPLDESAMTTDANNKEIESYRCMVTHTDNDLFGYSLDIFYNAAGNPDAMSFSGFPVTLEYDQRSRLRKTNYGTEGVHFEYRYNGNNTLPAVLNYYYPGITYPVNDGLIGIDSFEYNTKGEMIKRGITNLLFPQYNSGETYEYDMNGNVTKVSVAAQNGGTVFIPGYVVNEVSGYDHKRSFMGGNKWLKFILFHTELFPTDYFRMFSKNNPVAWTWGYDGGYNPISAEYVYNDKGFANSINLHLFDIDGVTELIAFTENSSSTCDDSEQKSQQAPSKRTELLPRNIFKLPGTLPLTNQ